MIGTRITITDDLARAVGRIATKHPNTAITIAYDDDYPEQEWLVETDAGYGSLTYIVDDQTGKRRVAGLGQRIPRPTPTQRGCSCGHPDPYHC